jgi:hypothetical protein
MVRPGLWFVTGQNAICYDQVDDLLLVWEQYVTTKFMICYWSERCMVRPGLWFVTGQNTVWYDQVYDLLLVRTLYGKTRLMICYIINLVEYNMNTAVDLYVTITYRNIWHSDQ